MASFIRTLASQGVAAGAIGVFVREAEQVHRAREAVEAAGQNALEICGRIPGQGSRVSVGIMHYAKGLEFKAVVVMGSLGHAPRHIRRRRRVDTLRPRERPLLTKAHNPLRCGSRR